MEYCDRCSRDESKDTRNKAIITVKAVDSNSVIIDKIDLCPICWKELQLTFKAD